MQQWNYWQWVNVGQRPDNIPTYLRITKVGHRPKYCKSHIFRLHRFSNQIDWIWLHVKKNPEALAIGTLWPRSFVRVDGDLYSPIFGGTINISVIWLSLRLQHFQLRTIWSVRFICVVTKQKAYSNCRNNQQVVQKCTRPFDRDHD